MASEATSRAILAVAALPPQKSGGVAAALWFFLAGFGGPWWYLGRPVSALFAMVAYWICGALIVVGVGLVLLPMLWVVDALTVWSSLRADQKKREKQLRKALAG